MRMRNGFGLLALVLVLSLLGCLPTDPVAELAITVRVGTLDALRAALQAAAVQPGTTIRLTADITSTDDVLLLQGRKTTLDLNGHALLYNNSFNGTNRGGCGLYVTPTLGDAGPVPADTRNVILCNPPGTVADIETAAGGNVVPPFREPAPIQYGDEKALRDTYTLARVILVPADTITIKNGTMGTLAPQAFGAASAAWARNVTFRNVTFIYHTILTNVGTGAQESENVRFINCDFGGFGCAFNSAYNTEVTGCKNGGVNYEERCVRGVVQDSDLTAVRSNDATCTGFTITRNHLTNPDVNYGCIALMEVGDAVITNNRLEGCASMWVGTVAKGKTLTLKGNTGRQFTQFGSGNVVQSGNSWQAAGGTN